MNNDLDVNVDDKLHRAVKENNISSIKLLLNDSDTDVYKLDDNGKIAISYADENNELMEILLTEGSRFPINYKNYRTLRNNVSRFLEHLKQMIIVSEKYKKWPTFVVRNYLLMLKRYEFFTKNSTMFWLEMKSGERTMSRQMELILDPKQKDTTFNFFRIDKMKPIDTQCIDEIAILKTLVDFKDYQMFVHIYRILDIFDVNSDLFCYFLYKRMFLQYSDLQSNNDFLPAFIVIVGCLKNFDFLFYLQLIKANKLNFPMSNNGPLVLRHSPNQNMETLKSGLNFGFLIHFLNKTSPHFMEAFVPFEFITLRESNYFYTACSKFIKFTKSFTTQEDLNYIYDSTSNDTEHFVDEINKLKTIYITSKTYSLFDLLICKNRCDLSNYSNEFYLLVKDKNTTVKCLRQFLCIRFAEIKAQKQLIEILNDLNLPLLVIYNILEYLTNIDFLYFYLHYDKNFTEIYQ